MNSHAVLDASALDVIRSLQQPGSEDLVSKIISMFLEDAARYANEVGEAVQQASADRLGAAAHSLKSCAANVGAMQVSAIAAELERLGRSGSVEGAGERYAELETAIAAARERLITQLDG